MPERTLIVMVKEPRAGRVKTRLGRDIGMAPAAWWYRHQVAGLLRRLTDPRWRIVLAVSPDSAAQPSRHWPMRWVRRAQGRGDLGARMRRQLLAARPGPVVLIGSDIPGVSRTQIARAFQALGGQDCVLGPAPDGGYWLIGLATGARPPQGWLRGVRWSTEHALADTRASWPGARTTLVATLQDIDTAADLADKAT